MSRLLLRRKRSSSLDSRGNELLEDIPLIADVDPNRKLQRQSTSTSSFWWNNNRSTTPQELELVASAAPDSTLEVLCAHAASTLEDEGSSSDSSLSILTPGCIRPKTDDATEVSETPDASRRKKGLELDVHEYMASREMTPQQERWNAITMIPNPLFCIYFILSGLWISTDVVEQARQDLSSSSSQLVTDYGYSSRGLAELANKALGQDDNGCLNPSFTNGWWFLPALPPFTLIAVAIGVSLQAPFSFLYHWKYAWQLPPGKPRITHWSRRMDHAMIHFASAFISYATSGSWDYFLVNAVYNADCIYRQFQTKVRPRRNKVRVMISILAYTIPVMKRGDYGTFCKLWIMFAIAGWLFGKYPIGGWSHSAFHLVLCLLPPLIMEAALDLEVSKEQVRLAARCVALAEAAAKHA